MAEIDFSQNAQLRKKVWSMVVWQHEVAESFWLGSGMMGAPGNTNAPVTRINELTQTIRGSVCVMPLVGHLSTDGGVAGDNTLEGNEQDLATDSLEIRIDLWRNAVKNRGQMSEQDTVLRFSRHGAQEIAIYYARVIDELGFLTASGIPYTKRVDGSLRPANAQHPYLRFAADVTPPSANRKLFGGTATSTATLTASDKLTWAKVVSWKAEFEAKLLKPTRVKGADVCCLVAHPYAIRDLRLDPDFMAAAREGDTRGLKSNILFTGAEMVVSGIPIFSHTRVCNTYGAPSGQKYGASGTVDGCQALLMGAQALAWASLSDPERIESDFTDYQNKRSAGLQQIFGWLKPNWLYSADNYGAREDFGLMSCYVAAAKG